MRTISLLSSLALLIMVLAGVASTDQRPIDEKGDTAGSPAACTYDSEKGAIDDYRSLVQFTDPSKGSADAPVTVIEFMDPNCPHCKNFHPVMKKVAAKQSERAHFIYKPFPLWKYSIPQVLALHVAAQQGKFFDMLEQQFAMQQQGGLSMAQLRGIAQEIGLNADKMVRQMRDKALLQSIMQERQQAAKAGVTSMPTVLINGRFVAPRSRTPACLNQLIRKAAQQQAEG